MNKIENIKGLLIDLEGVLYSDNKVIDGSIETIDKLRKKYKIRFLTNTTTTSRNSIFKKLINLEFNLKEDDIFTPSIAINHFLKNNNINNIFLMTNPDLVPDFKNFIIDDKSPKAVIIGDIYKEFNWITLNHVFQLINNNECLLIALHKNKYCMREDTISLDLGPFISALEYASNKNEVVIGKPEKDFFDLAINSLNLNKDEILMIGDDIISDIKGSKDNLIKAIQVKTGKYQKHDENSNFIQPDIRIKSINDLPNVINN